MTTDPLLTAFAEQLGLSEDEARPALERVIASLRTTLESGAGATLEGVGTFARSGAGHTFEPDALLVAAVNGDYAGLSPVSEPVPVPFLTSFPVVPAAALEEPTITPVDVVEEGPDEPVTEAVAPPETIAEAFQRSVETGTEETIELGTNDDLADPGQHQEERDRDLAAVMAGVWTPPPSPPVAALETPNEDFEPAVAAIESDDDQGTLSFEEAGFSFVAETPARAEEPAVPPPYFAPAVAAPFAATASTSPVTATPPAIHTRELELEEDGGWSRLWLVLPLLGLVAVGLWWWSRRDGGDDSAGTQIAAQPATGATGSGEPISAGGAPVDPSADSALAAADAAQAGDEPAAAEPVAEPAPAPAEASTATPPSPGGAGAYRPAPIPTEQTPAREPTGARTEPTPARAVPARDPTARPGPTREAIPASPETAAVRPSETAPAGVWGIRGTVPVDPSAGGFTWILASTDAADARERVAIYRSLGFRAAVLTAFVGGRQVYRVAVGQFAGAGEARAARSQLPNDAPADAWLLRLGRTP